MQTKWKWIFFYLHLKLMLNVKGEPMLPCGFPGRPASGRVVPKEDSYEHNKRIIYTCDDSYILEGPPFNICNNGTWINDVPLCYLNIAFGKTASQSGTNKAASLAVDDNVNTCSKTTFDAHPWWSVDLQKTYAIKQVNITAETNTKVIKMEVQILRYKDDPQPKLCTVINETLTSGYSKTFVHKCASDVSGRIVQIVDLRTIQKSMLILCDVQVTSKDVSLNQWPCGDPSNSPNCEVNVMIGAENIQTAVYTASQGYKIEDNTTRKCVGARWQPDKTPKCSSIPNYKELSTDDMRLTEKTVKEANKETKPVETNFIIGIAIGVTAASISTVVVIIVVIYIMKKYYRGNRNDVAPSTFSDNSAVYLHTGSKHETSDGSGGSPPVLLYSNPWDDPRNHVYDYIDLDTSRKVETSPLTPDSSKKPIVDNIGYLMHRHGRMSSSSQSNKSRTGSSSTRGAGGSTSTASVQESLLSIGDTDTLPMGGNSGKNSPRVASTELDDIYRFPEE